MSASRYTLSSPPVPAPISQCPDLLPLLQHAYERYVFTMLSALDSEESQRLINDRTHPQRGFKLAEITWIASHQDSRETQQDLFLAPGLPLQTKADSSASVSTDQGFLSGARDPQYHAIWSQLVWNENLRAFEKDKHRIKQGDPDFNFSSFHQVTIEDQARRATYTAIVCSQTLVNVTPEGSQVIRPWTKFDSAVLPFGFYTPSRPREVAPAPVPQDLRHLDLTHLQLPSLRLRTPATFTFNGAMRTTLTSHSLSHRKRQVYQPKSAGGGNVRLI
ncbi:hypothetical protein JCM5350_003519 [Sporobolomyces pararoseus]